MKQKKQKTILIKAVAVLLAAIMLLCQPFSLTYTFAGDDDAAGIELQETAAEDTSKEAEQETPVIQEEADTPESTESGEENLSAEDETKESAEAEQETGASEEETAAQQESVREEPATSLEGAAEEETTSIIETEPETESADEKESLQEEEASETAQEAEDISDLMSINELRLVPDTVAEATVEKEDASRTMQLLEEGKDWQFSIYYVNQNDLHNVFKTDDFNLKYQFVFGTSVDIEANAVEIRIPKYLIYYGHGAETRQGVAPSDVGVPRGSYDSATDTYTFTKTRKSPFNYYEDGDNLVFFNYEKIEAGKTAGIQVLYRDLDVMEIEDTYSWHMVPEVKAVIHGSEQGLSEAEKALAYLDGQVDTQISLQTTAKRALSGGRNYTPELYTEKQLRKYVPDLSNIRIPGTSERLTAHFDEYVYMVWEIDISGYATQPYNLILDEETYYYDYGSYPSEQQNGFLIGLYDVSNGLARTVAKLDDTDEKVNTDTFKGADFSKERSLNKTYYAVTAHPKDAVEANKTILNNNIRATMKPYDQIDNDQSMNSGASWMYRDYKWTYSGDIIGVRKSGTPTELNSWTTVYGLIDEDTDLSTSDFTVNGTCFSYSLTHNIAGADIGKYIPGRSAKVTTVDDVVYAFPQNGSRAGAFYILDSTDYYFNKVKVSIEDHGYDVYEDEISGTVPVSETGEMDRSMHVFAMFAGSDSWEEVAVVPWDLSGNLSYTFTGEQIKKEPWRIKIEHNAVDYVTYSKIETNISIRGDSPKFKDFSDADAVTLENIGGIMGQYMANGVPMQFGKSDERGYFQDQNTNPPNYQEPYLANITYGLYGTILMRDSQLIRLLPERRMAYARKGGTATNDVVNSRAKVRYIMEGFEGYNIYSNEAIPYMRNADIDIPHRTEMVFYDLLPFGVQFDPSGKLTGGRLTSNDLSRKLSEGSWDKNQVEVTLDPETDIIQNYKDTGRTLLRFHVNYSGADSSVSGKNDWFTGFGIAFDAYVTYEDYESATEMPNIVAYMPGSSDKMKDIIIGEDSQVSLDNGSVVSSDGFARYYKDLGSDINGDGKTDTRNVLYAQSQVFTDMALAADSMIQKFVRAEDDPFGMYKKSTTVLPGQSYEYKITVTATAAPLKDIIFFDRIENAIADRQIQEPGVFDKTDWKGTFDGLILTELIEAGANPRVYYNASRTAAVPAEFADPYSALNAENGWILAENWSGDLSEVHAFAVDISSGDYTVDFMDSVSVRVKMIAPETSDATWAYNNPAFYCTNTITDVSATQAGNSVKIKFVDARAVEVEKELGADTPSAHMNDSFRFFAAWNDGSESQPYAFREYELYSNVAGDGQTPRWILQDGIYATNVEGAFELHAKEKAVFRETDIEKLEITEEKTLLWELEDGKLSDTTKDGVRTIKAVNLYRPILYIYKEVTGFSQALAGEINLEKFEMKLTRTDGSPVSDKEMYVVQSADTNGGEPVVIDAEHKNFGALRNGRPDPEYVRTLRTDANGIFTIYAGEVIAIPLREEGETFTVTEVASCYAEESDWICEDPDDSGTLSDTGALLSITNQYRWKVLDITKTIEDAGYSDLSNVEFTFKLYEAAGESGTDKGSQIRDGFKWQLLESIEDEEDENAWQEPGENGEITAACAGKVIRVSRFKAGTRVIVEEVLEGAVADAFSTDSQNINVRIPVYAISGKAEIVNNYLYRDLSVTKTVVRNNLNDDISKKNFTMVLEKQEGEADFAPAAGQAYILFDKDGEKISTEQPSVTDDKGAFELADGQKAVFAGLAKDGANWRIKEAVDEEYPPLVPEASEDDPLYSDYISGVLTKGENRAEFVNGNDGILIIRKNWVGNDDSAQQYIDSYNSYYYGYLQTTIYVDLDGKQDDVQVISYRNADWYTGSYWDNNSRQYVYMMQINLYGDNSYVILADKARLGYSVSDGFNFDELDYTIIETKSYYRYKGTYLNPSFNNNGYFQDALGRTYQINPDQNEIIISGTPKENPLAELENHISSYESVVQKRVIGEDVSAGSELVWRVEQYTDGQWLPAEGVGYCIDSFKYDYFNYNGNSRPIPVSTGVTGKDGLIRIVPDTDFCATTQGSATMPPRFSIAYVLFDRKVYVNHYIDVKEGDLRVSEVKELSSDEWGVLQSYTTSAASPGNISPNYTSSIFASGASATGFVNGTRKDQLKIEKVVDVDTDMFFEFTLKKYTYLLSNDYIEPGSYLEYTIYDKETDMPVRSGVTGADGSFKMQGGQYAVFQVPPSCRWKVTEKAASPYYLQRIEINGQVVAEDTSSADISMAGNEDDLTKSDMLKPGWEFSAALRSLLNKAGIGADNNRNNNITEIYFGYKSDYADAITDISQVVDSKDLGTIKAYLGKDTSNGIKVYVLSDDPMYANYYSTGMFQGLNWLQNIVFDNFDTGKTTNMSFMFNLCTSLQEVDISSWDTSSVTDMSNMFSNCYNLTNIVGITGIDTSKVTTMRGLFMNCRNITELDLSSWNTSSVTNMSEMFASDYWIGSGFSSLNLGGWNTSKVTDMSRMFYYDYNLSSLNTDGWDTSAVTNMSYMFYNCNRITSLPVSDWDVSSVSDMSSMFARCMNLNSLDLHNWNTAALNNTNYMFGDSTNLEHILIGDSWTVESVTSSGSMFSGCPGLPHYNRNYTDRSRAYAGGEGYLEYIGSVTVYSNDESLGTVSGSFTNQTHGVLVAEPAQDRSFLGWYLNGELLSKRKQYDFYCGKDQPYSIEGRFSPESVTLEIQVYLNPGVTSYGWSEYNGTNPAGNDYMMFQSTNKGVNSSYSVMKVVISGTDEYTFYINSDAETTYDYTYVSNIDAAYDNSEYLESTSGFQKPPTVFPGNWKAVTVQPDDLEQHVIYIVYRKDGSVHTGDDRGYVLLPDVTEVN